MRLKKFNEEVFFPDDEIITAGLQDVKSLKKKAKGNKRKRVRLCTHKDIKDELHEMFIVHTKNAYVRPHKHLNKIESLHVIEGTAKALIFDENGNVTNVIQLGNYRSGYKFYYRFFKPEYHSLLITTGFFVFHEVTNGPFDRSDTVFAPWSPEENDSNSVMRFMEELKETVKTSSPTIKL